MWKFAYFELERISWKVRTRILVTACDLVTVCVCVMFLQDNLIADSVGRIWSMLECGYAKSFFCDALIVRIAMQVSRV